MSRLPRAEIILPLAIVFGAVVLIASEFMVTFELTAGGEPQGEQLASDRHTYSLLLLALFAVAAMVVALATGLRGAALATAAFGVAALLLFLLLDLPDAGNTGTFESDESDAIYFATAKAEPQIGFWLEAIGSLTLGLAAIAFATLTGEQLRAPARLLARRREERRAEPMEREAAKPAETTAAAQAAPKPAPAGKTARPAPTRPAGRRPRSRRDDDAIVPFDAEADESTARPSENGRRSLLSRLRSSNR